MFPTEAARHRDSLSGSTASGTGGCEDVVSRCVSPIANREVPVTDPPRRVRYFHGRLLSAEDFEAEQTYHRQMRYLSNRLCGVGIAEGLDVTLDGRSVEVSPGVAIDPLGRELVLTEPARLPLRAPRSGDPDRWDVVLVWGEDLVGPVPVVGGESEAAWVVERPRVHLVPPGRVPEEAVALARLSRTRTGVTVDTAVRHQRGHDLHC
jgi:hypothetical protein